jgi:ADP-ribosylglycohydrolase
MLTINKSEYRKKALGCWLGKAAGGTLGMPYEGQDGPLDLDYYRPVPETMLPNDDLDLQVLWACVMDKMDKPKVDKNIIGNAWIKHVEFPWDEYGVCIRNLKNGIRPPFSGICDNWFYNGMGAAIRSEIWACLAPGNPSLAAEYAYEDACTDHSGDGIWAEIFMSVMESLCFRESDIRLIIIKSASYLPLNSNIRNVAIDTMGWWDICGDWIKVRAMILGKYEHDNFTDTIQNIGFTILGLLAGNGDFGKTICAAVNCGKDTDCTGASAGAVFGILYPDRIEDKWLKPIGRSLVLNKQITGITHPPTLDGFTDLVAGLYEKLEAGKEKSSSFEPPIVEAQIGYVTGNKFPEAGKNVDEILKKELPGTLQKTIFPGNYVRVPKELHQGRIIAVEYRVAVKSSFNARIMFSSKQETRVFLDGKFICAGKKIMAPSFHRAGEGQCADIEFAAGTHEILAFVKSDAGADAEWLFGIGDAKTKLWK